MLQRRLGWCFFCFNFVLRISFLNKYIITKLKHKSVLKRLQICNSKFLRNNNINKNKVKMKNKIDKVLPHQRKEKISPSCPQYISPSYVSYFKILCDAEKKYWLFLKIFFNVLDNIPAWSYVGLHSFYPPARGECISIFFMGIGGTWWERGAHFCFWRGDFMLFRDRNYKF